MNKIPIHKKLFPHIPIIITNILASLLLISFILYLTTDCIDDFLSNIITEIIGVIITLYIVEVIFSKQWFLVEVQLNKKITAFYDLSVHRLSLVLDILSMHNANPGIVEDDFKIWNRETSNKEKIEGSIKPVIKKYLSYLKTSDFQRLLVIIGKIEQHLLQIQQKYNLTKPDPGTIYILENIEDELHDLTLHLEGMLSNIPDNFKVYIPIIKEILLNMMNDFLMLDDKLSVKT